MALVFRPVANEPGDQRAHGEWEIGLIEKRSFMGTDRLILASAKVTASLSSSKSSEDKCPQLRYPDPKTSPVHETGTSPARAGPGNLHRTISGVSA
jgi:hypothetical protein